VSEGVILVVDDERLSRATLELQFQDEGFDVLTASNGFEALEILENNDADLMLTDLRMPSMDGRDLQRSVRDRWPELPIVFMTAFGTVQTAVDAMRDGAADYLTKPLNTEELVIRVRRLIQRGRDLQEMRRLRSQASRHQSVGQLVYRSAVMQAVVDRALSVADADVTVLIEGETGSGKAVIARLLHERSQRASGPFITVNCAELNPNLVESELFGHEAGAFTGAHRQRRGRFESAFGGTLLIDEVDDLPREIQVRLLRFLHDRTFERVGSSKTLQGDLRVLCATKRSLLGLVQEGRFREDLYYRINAISIALAPLRDRPDDIVPLAVHFVEAFSPTREGGQPEILPETLRLLLAHKWPGNVRELKHAMEHAVTFARGAPIAPAHLPPHLQPAPPPRTVSLQLDGVETVSFAEVMASCERGLLEWALARTGGNQARAAELLQMSRTTLRDHLSALREPGSAGPDDEAPAGGTQ